MKINKSKLSNIISEEIQRLEEDMALSGPEMLDIVDRLFRKLDSIDMSLDMIYGAVAETDEPIGVTRARQRSLGRLAGTKARTSKFGGD